MIFPESVAGFTELKASPLPQLGYFFLAWLHDFSLPMTQCWQEGKGLPEKQIARVQSYTSCPQKPLLPGILARVRSPEREEGGECQLLADIFLELALVEKKKKKKDICPPTVKRYVCGISKWWHGKEWGQRGGKDEECDCVRKKTKKDGCHHVWIWV